MIKHGEAHAKMRKHITEFMLYLDSKDIVKYDSDFIENYITYVQEETRLQANSGALSRHISNEINYYDTDRLKEIILEYYKKNELIVIKKEIEKWNLQIELVP